MRIINTIILAFACCISVCAGVVLKKNGSHYQLEIDNKPMLVLGGELSNSAATSVDDIDNVIPKMAQLGINTVFVPAQWDLMEPEEGKFDFSLIDETINKAKENNMKVIFLWFGAWKNSMSCYAPLWFKSDTKRFPRAKTENGKPLEIASAFSENVLQADKKAFLQLVQHIKNTDSDNTVIMIQVENEIGMLESARDYSDAANKEYNNGKWIKHVSIKGDENKRFVDEKFQAFYYAQYVEQLVKAGKKILNIPMYVNAAMNSRGRKPGEYPSAGPLAHLMDIWKSAAPDIDIYAPDIYDDGFKNWVSLYRRDDNPFFTPETRMSENSGVRSLYTFGEVDALGYSVFAIDQAPTKQTCQIKEAYTILEQLSPFFLQTSKQKAQKTYGLLFNKNDKERIIEDKNTILTCRHNFTLPWDPRATDGSEWPEGGGIIIKLASDEYIIAGNGIVVSFQTPSEKQQTEEIRSGEDGFADKGIAKTTKQIPFKGERIGIGYIDEVSISPDGIMNFIRRDNGDQDHQGRHARISVGDYRILHVKLYRY